MAEKKRKIKKVVKKSDQVKTKQPKDEKVEEPVDDKKILKEAEEREKEAKKKVKKEKSQKESKKEAAKEEPKKIEVARRQRKHGKKYRSLAKNIEQNKLFEIDEAIKTAKELSKTQFDATIELHLRLDKKVENLRGVVNFPSGTVKEKKVLEITEKNIDAEVEKVKVGKIDFDIMITKPAYMPKLAMLAKILGPKGLMPNPKNGTVTENVKEAAEEFRGNKVEFKPDKGNNIHFALAKVSWPEDKIKANLEAALSAVPIGKVLSAFLTTTMGPSIRIKTSK